MCSDARPSDLGRANGHGTSVLLETGSSRDEMASRRDAAAQIRDDFAAERDRDAHIRDEAAGGFEQSGDRRTALDDRARARRDRALAARDRELAARDREEAAGDRRQAGVDELTGARRRGIGLEELQREIERSQRMGERLVAVYVDVDNLKAVNDGLGHGAGDELLCEVADGLKRHVRSYDLVVRLGGDEFLCVLPDVTLADAHGRFDDLKAELDGGSTDASVSVGFAALREGESSQNLVERADHDLLAARGH
jgi:diguanylate cyclase (GGDEF)-like protein